MNITYAEKESEFSPYKVGDIIKTETDVYLISCSNNLPTGKFAIKLVNLKTNTIVKPDFDTASQAVEFFTKGSMKVEVFEANDVELVIRSGVNSK